MIQEKKHKRKRKNKKPSAMAQVHNRVNAGVMDGVVYGGMMEESKERFKTWYRGYNAKYGSDHDHLLWLIDDIDYARTYGNRVEEVILDGDKLNSISVTDLLDCGYDYLDGPDEEGCEEMMSEGYNCYYFEANDDSSYCMCLWDKSAIVSRRELSRGEFDKIEGYEGYDNPGYDVDLNEAAEPERNIYEIGFEDDANSYAHILESDTSEDMIQLYHGVRFDGLEYDLEVGGLVPKVCSEGGPKAVWLSEKQYGYPFIFMVTVPKDGVSQLSNVDYIYEDVIPLDDSNCELVRTSFTVEYEGFMVEINIKDDSVSKRQFEMFPELGNRLEEMFEEKYPNIYKTYIVPFIKRHTGKLNESSDCVKFDGHYYDCYDHDAIAFISFIRKDGSKGPIFVGPPGNLHGNLEYYLIGSRTVTPDEYGRPSELKKDERRTGRFWFGDGCNIISFYSYPESTKQIYNNCVEALLAIKDKTGEDFNIGEVMVDLWTKSIRNTIIMPVRWFNNGMADMFLPIVNKCEPYEDFDGSFRYRITTSKGKFTADWRGDDIEQEQDYGALRESKETEKKVDYNKYIKSLIDFMREQHLNIDPLPEIELNPEEQDGLFIKTGYYSPDEKKVVVFTDGRHPKDVLRTVAHEFIHHMQNLQNPDKDWGTGGDLEEDSRLRSIEGEAFLLGNIIFREWTEKMKKTKELNESIQGGTNLDEFWNGDGDEMDFIYPEDIPDKLYHISPTKNRESILKNGLMPSVGDEYFDWWSYESPNGDYEDLCDMPELVFLTSNPNTWLECLGGSDYDLYEIDTKQLDKGDISLDPTPSLAKRGCYCYGGIIPPRAIKLIKTIEPEEYTTLNESINIKKALKDLKKRKDPDNIENWNRIDEIEAEIVEPDDVDLSSFNIKKHLNPKFWDDGHLDTRIRLKLLDIADDFFDSLDVDWVEPEDIIITGSLANYNWNDKYSDIDLHILVDYEDVDERVDFVREYFTLKKNEWNQKHKGIKIFGFPVEVYVQDSNEPHASSGVYSIDKDEWITEPDRDKIRSGKVDKRHIREMISTYMNKIDCLIDIYKKHKDDEYEMSRVSEEATEILDEIKKLRKDDLAKYGREMCDGNIIFKALRRSDYIGKLMKLKNLAYDKLNSI